MTYFLMIIVFIKRVLTEIHCLYEYCKFTHATGIGNMIKMGAVL